MRHLLSRIKSVIFSSLRPDTEQVQSHAQCVQLHACVIDQQAHIVYPKDLSIKSPDLFRSLARHYQQQGIRLKEDQRAGNRESTAHSDRRRWAPVVLFSASLMFENSALADMETSLMTSPGSSEQRVELRLLSSTPVRQLIHDKIHQYEYTDTASEPAVLSTPADRIFAILHAHYRKQDNDPAYIFSDLKTIAVYYSQFPEVITMLERLDTRNWELQFDENEWMTLASGSRLQVNRAIVHFNTRSAAQLRLNSGCKNNPVCIASPADALLHELLHTFTMLVETNQFLSQGGMNTLSYPVRHEYTVIDAERNLYASMSQQDSQKRPQRYDHSGRIVKVHCPTCIH